MNISFIPSTQTLGYYDLVVEGQSIVVDINPNEVVECISKLKEQEEIISQFDLFLRASEKCNFDLPDPIIKPGSSQLLFIEETKTGFATKVLEVWDRISDNGESFLIFCSKEICPPVGEDGVIEVKTWGFYINRNTKEVGELVGSDYRKPWGELRSRILEVLIQRLGRSIKINI